MDRRRIFLVVAVIVALMGTALVFLYVRGADQRAESRFETVEVLRATQAITARCYRAGRNPSSFALMSACRLLPTPSLS